MNPLLDKEIYNEISSYWEEINSCVDNQDLGPLLIYGHRFLKQSKFGEIDMNIINTRNSWKSIGKIGETHVRLNKDKTVDLPRRINIFDGPYTIKDNNFFFRHINSRNLLFRVNVINKEYNLNLPDDYFSWTNEDVLMLRMCL